MSDGDRPNSIRAIQRLQAVLIGTTMLVLLSFVGLAFFTGVQLRKVAESNQVNMIEHRKASRCLEALDIVVLSYFVRTVQEQGTKVPASVLRTVRLVPPANLSGIDCHAALRNHLPTQIENAGEGGP